MWCTVCGWKFLYHHQYLAFVASVSFAGLSSCLSLIVFVVFKLMEVVKSSDSKESSSFTSDLVARTVPVMGGFVVKRSWVVFAVSTTSGECFVQLIQVNLYPQTQLSLQLTGKLNQPIHYLEGRVVRHRMSMRTGLISRWLRTASVFWVFFLKRCGWAVWSTLTISPFICRIFFAVD